MTKQNDEMTEIFGYELAYETALDYVNLPMSEKTKFNYFWFWEPWYEVPYFGFSSTKELMDYCSEDVPMHKSKVKNYRCAGLYLKKNFPLQYFLRECVVGNILEPIDHVRLHISHTYESLIMKIDAFLFPKQKFLTSKIPSSWCDKEELIEICLFEILVNFVEKEKYFNNTDLNLTEKEKQINKEIEFCYKSIKKTLPELQDKIDNLNFKDYGLHDVMEEQDELKALICKLIVKNKNYLSF